MWAYAAVGDLTVYDRYRFNWRTGEADMPWKMELYPSLLSYFEHEEQLLLAATG